MTTGPDSPERDPALERAWRAHSREGPPAELDRAILAAAHRAVGSGPAEAAPAREANRPQRWWMPLAAAATIGAVAVGLLQMSPQDASLVAPTERVAAVAPPRELAKQAPVAAPATPEAAADARARVVPTTPARPGDNEAARARRQDAPATASATPPPVPAPPAAVAARPPMPLAPPPPPASPPAATPAPAAPAAPLAAAREAPAVVGRLAAPAPEPFPAAPAPRKGDSAEMKSVAPGAGVPAAAGTAQASRVEGESAPTAADAQDKRELARKDSAEADRRQATESPATRAPAQAAAGTAAPLAAGPSPAPAPAPPAAATRTRDNAVVRDASREQAAPAALAKRAAPSEDGRTKARDPDAWIAQIRKLRDEGRTAEAIRELREFREFVPDAERRIPPDLRELAASIRP